MIRWNLFFEVEKVEQLALIDRLATHHDRPPSLKASGKNGIMIRRYQRGLFQQDRPEADIDGFTFRPFQNTDADWYYAHHGRGTALDDIFQLCPRPDDDPAAPPRSWSRHALLSHAAP
jgi:hypothetical protein